MVERRRRYASASGGVGDTIAPALTLPLALPLGDTTGYLGVTTNEANGTLYYVVTTSATPPSAAQVKAGQNNGGTSAVYAGSQAIGSTGAKTATATGLSSNTAYYAYFMHEDAVGNQSTVSAASSFTTLTTGTSDTSFDNLIAAASVGLADLRKGYVARFIQALYAGSLWGKIDAMWVLAAHDEQFGRLNWKSPGSFTLTAVNSPTFTADRGFTGNGSTSYLDTGWDAATNGVQYQQNDAHAAAYGLAGSASNVGIFGTGASSFNTQVATSDGAGGAFCRINSGGTPVGAQAGQNRPHLILGRRNNSTTVDVVRRGVVVTTAGAQTSSSKSSTDLVFCRTGTQYNNQRCAFGSVGAYLDDTEAAAHWNAVHDYAVAIGADT